MLGFLAGLAFAWANLAHAGDQRYQAGPEKVVEIALELRDVLEPKCQAVIQKQPLTVVEDARPSLRLVEEQTAAGAEKAGTLVMSTGFLELMNRAAHAAAIDELEKGYLRQYLLAWPVGEVPAVLPGLPKVDNPKYWSEEVMDRQMTCFAQMVGLALGIEYANYYLGHFAKYKLVLLERKFFK